MAKTTAPQIVQDLQNWKRESSYEDIKLKQIIKSELLSDALIIHALNNTNLNENNSESYYGINILPYYLLTPVQSDVQNYICYETGFTELQRYNDVMKLQQITFYILCSCKPGNIIDSSTGAARHDLIASLIIDKFNWENTFGMQVHLISDQSRPVDNDFCARTLVFEQNVPNSIVKNGRVMNTVSDKI